MTDITVIGDVNVDLLTSPIDVYPKKDLQTIIDSTNLVVGGGAANSAFTFCKIGLKTRLVGLIGNDIFGEFIKRKIKEFGIEDSVKISDKVNTGISLGIHFKDGSRSLFTYRGTNHIFSLKDFRLEELKGKIVYISGYNFLDGLRKDFKKILLYSKKKKMLVGLDPDIKSGIRFSVKDFRRTLKLIDIFFLNMKEGVILTGKKGKMAITKALLNYGCKIVVLHCGNKGCVVGSKNKIFTIEGIKVKPINPTGTGDIFNAGFVFEYMKTKDIKKAGIFANATGALAVTRTDEKRFATEKEVINFLRKKS